MAKNIMEIKDLAKHAVRGTVPADFTNSSIDEVNETLREELGALAKDYYTFQKNKYDIFQIIQEAMDEVVPKRVLDIMGQFAEVRQFANNVKPSFKIKKGRNRAKRFITRAAASGVYEAFRLDTDTVDVTTFCVGGAAYIDFDRFNSGEEVLSDYTDVLTEGIEDTVYVEVQKALRASIDSPARPTANKVSDSSFNADNMAKLCATVKAYGNGAVIFATPEFVATMGPDEIKSGVTPNVSVNDIEDIRTKGFIGIFRGCPIVQLPQSFTDETNTHTVLDPQMAYVFPTGGEKIVKVAFEGQTMVEDYKNRDQSMEIQAYKKLGIAIMTVHNWGIYRNTGISQTFEG